MSYSNSGGNVGPDQRDVCYQLPPEHEEHQQTTSKTVIIYATASTQERSNEHVHKCVELVDIFVQGMSTRAESTAKDRMAIDVFMEHQIQSN